MTPSQRQFLRELALAAIESARIPAGAIFTGASPSQAGFPSRSNELGFDVIRPGGRDCYPALWIQDFTMSYSSGLIPPELGERHLAVIAGTQNGPEARHLTNGAIIPPWAVADHINLDGSPVFFPGTYSSADDQGGEPFGRRPPANNHFDFVWLAWLRWKEENHSAEYLCRAYSGVPLMDRLRAAFAAVETDGDNGLVYTSANHRSVGFIFFDSVYMTGHLLMASLLRYRAAQHLAEMAAGLGDADAADGYRIEARRIATAVSAVFPAPETNGGWLRASTGVSGQADVWGTLYALCLGILDRPVRQRAERQMLRDLAVGTIEYAGAFRHIPTDRDAGPDTAWERTITPYNVYQNGAFWHTPSGWAIYALGEIAPEAADAVFERYIASLLAGDFRQGSTYCAPWETIGREEKSYQNPIFLPSVALPLAVLTDPCRAGLAQRYRRPTGGSEQSITIIESEESLCL